MRKLIFALGCLLIFGLPTAGQAAHIWWVDPNGSADFNNIQAAINSSGTGDTIIVKPGTYSQNLAFNHKAVTVTSQDPNVPSIVQSTIITVSSGHCVTFDSAEDSNSVITGFTIKAIAGRGIDCNGTSPSISKNVIKNCASSGIYGELDAAAPIISGNTITSNGGYGIYSCNGPITDNTISDNNNGGIGSCDGPITNNIISNNSNTTPGFGGGLSDCQGQITYNTVTDNYAYSNGGGLYFCGGKISNNVIVGNITNYEGGGLSSCHGNIGNNIIAGNVSRSSSGGGLCECRGTIYNNTITGNRASYYGGAIYNCGGFVRNNILASNEVPFESEGGGISGLCQNSYNAFSGNVGGNFRDGAVPGTGDIFPNDPCFAANGWWNTRGTGDPSDDKWINGDYHLKSQAGRWDPNNEMWVTDSETSPCIDAGDPNSDWTAELWPHGKRINMGAYGGTPEASMSLSSAGNVADIDDDDYVDFNDMLLMTEVWLSDQILLAEDLNRDRIVNLVDFAILAGNWRPGPPTPNPITWATPPYATSPHSIAMIATTATTTDWSGVEYYFEDFEHPQSNSGWLSFAPGQQPMWENTGLTSNTEYWYRVKARNKLNLLETGWSQVASATTPTEDTTKPTPDPMTWETEPYATSPTSILMVAHTATDDSGVQYFFECTTDANYSSNWQDETEYTLSSLPKRIYTFVVRARDKSPLHNTTGNSNPVTVDLKPPTPDPMTWATPPYATSFTSIRMVATTASDYSGVQYFFECTSDANYSSTDWQNSSTYEVTSLPPAVYTFVVRAQDKSPNYNTTANSTPVTVDLKPPTPDPMTWATPPYATSSSSIRMVASTASDYSGVQYFFECTSHPGYSSSWRDSSTYDVNSLPKGVYTFVTRARDKSPIHNTTADSNAVTVDMNAPTPNPMQWASGGEPKVILLPPYTSWDYGATMTAAEATDESGVEYKFVCSDSDFSSGGKGDSGPEWRNSDNVSGDPKIYTVKMGQKAYVLGETFRVKARDRSPSHNTTSPSSPPLYPQE
jgi:hypothetical protein